VAITHKGCVCLIPRRAQPGDAIWLADGAQTPYMIRSRGTKGVYEFVGDYYVHGVMDGSAVDAGGSRELIKA
jgi:hypothetical protein